MTTALTELIDAQREIRVEALIVLLIAVEIVIWLYDFFLSEADDWLDPACSGDFL